VPKRHLRETFVFYRLSPAPPCPASAIGDGGPRILLYQQNGQPATLEIDDGVENPVDHVRFLNSQFGLSTILVARAKRQFDQHQGRCRAPALKFRVSGTTGGDRLLVGES
jgi:hypothetical protein